MSQGYLGLIWAMAALVPLTSLTILDYTVALLAIINALYHFIKWLKHR